MIGAKNKYKFSSILPKNDFIIGLGSIFNLSGSYFEYHPFKKETDIESIHNDWRRVGKDLENSTKEFKKKATK